MILLLVGFLAGVLAMALVVAAVSDETNGYADYWFHNSNRWMRAYFDLRDGGQEGDRE